MNYKIWTNNEDSRELIIEIYNKKDVHEVQKIFVDKNYIIEAFDNNEHNQFKGYVKVNKLIVNNKLLLEFEVDGCKLKAEWQAGDNYGVWQQCGYSGDDYSGYLLFPTHTDNEYFCLWYKC